MLSDEINIRYIGGPTALFQIGGLRFITDPTFDEKATEYGLPGQILTKLSNPLIAPQQLDKMDFVLLTDDQHFANLDHTGREYLNYVEYVFSTPEAAARIGGNAIGLKCWQSADLETKDGRTVVLVATPCFASTAPMHIEATGIPGSATGFVLYLQDEPSGAVYITGSTVFNEGMKEIAARFDIRLVLPYMGAGLAVSLDLARLFDKAVITPLHFEGWSNLTEGARAIHDGFVGAGLSSRLKWPYGFNARSIS